MKVLFQYTKKRPGLFRRSNRLIWLLGVFLWSSTAIRAQCTPTISYIQGANGLVNFTASTSFTNTSTSIWTWNFGDASAPFTGTGSVGMFPSHAYTVNGTYIVSGTMTAFSPTCSTPFSLAISVTTNTNCPLSPSFAVTQNTNGVVAFSNLSTGTAASVSYNWNLGNTQTTSVQSPTTTYSANGTYTVTLFASNNSTPACTNSYVAAVTITNVNACSLVSNFIFSQGSNGFVSFTNTSAGTASSTTYTWNFGNSLTSSLTSPAINYTANGTYTVSLTANNNSTATCINTKTAVITINSICTLTAAISPTLGSNGTVSYTAVHNGTAVSYNWSNGSTVQATSMSYTANGVYTVTVTVNSFSPACTATAVSSVTVNNVCNLSASFTVVQGSNGLVNFNNLSTATTSSTTYSWNFGNSQTSTLTSPAITYTANGLYLVTLTANNNTTPSCISTNTLLVNVGSVCTLTAAVSSTYGPNGQVALAAVNNGTNPTYAWSFGAVQPTANLSFSVNGTYTVGVVVTTTAPACSATAIAGLTISNVCNLNASLSVVQGTGGIVSFSNLSTGASPTLTTYKWYFGDGDSSSVNSPVHTYSVNGTYTVLLKATNGSTACASTYTTVIVVTSNCYLSGSFSYSVNSSGVVSFSNTSSGTFSFTSYGWSLGHSSGGNPGTSTLSNVSHLYPNGTYTVTLSITNSSFCAVNVSSVITISSCSVSAGISHTAGVSGTYSFQSPPTTTASGTNYQWNFGDGGLSNNPNPVHTYINAGTHYVSLILSNAGNSLCVSSATQAVNVTNVSCTANSGFSIVPTTTAQYWNAIPSYPYNITNAVWSWGDNSSSSGLYTSHQYSTQGQYNICLSVTVSCGATASTCSTYSVYKPAQGIINVNVLPPPTHLEIMGISQDQGLSQKEMIVFPNPGKGLFTLKSVNSAFDPGELNVTDMNGRIVKSSRLTNQVSGEVMIDLRDQAEGVYILSVRDEVGLTYRKLIIKKD